MYKVLRVNGKDMELKSNAATEYRYKQIFRKELKKDLLKLENANISESVDTIEYIQKLAYIMHCQALNTIQTASVDGFMDWLESYDEEDFMNEETMIEIMSVWNKNLDTSSIPKKDTGPQQEN